MWNNSYGTPTERWQKTSDLPKGKKLPKYLGRAKEKRKNRDKRIGMGPAPLGGSCEGGKISTHQEAPSLAEMGGWGGRGSFGAMEESTATGGKKGKEERFPHRGLVPTSTHQPEKLVCSPTGTGGGWELRFGLQRSDPRERTGVCCVNTARRGLVHHS